MEPLRLTSRRAPAGRPATSATARWPVASSLRQPFGLTVAVLSVLTVAFVVLPDLRFATYAPELDIAIHTLGTVASLAVAALCYVRFREQGGLPLLLQSSAFVVLGVANLVNELIVLGGWDARVGLSLGDPGQMPLYFWAAARLVSAALIAMSAFPDRFAGPRWVRRPAQVVWLPTVLLLLGITVLLLVPDAIPDLVDPVTLRRLAEESFSSAPLPGINLGILILDGAAAILLAVAAIRFVRAPERPGGIPADYLVVGLLIAVYAQVHFLLYPAVYSGLVSTGDALRIAFYVVLMLGVNASARADLRDLRAANARLRLLAVAERDRAAIAERGRLARELHDGLAQDLWTTTLEFDRLTSMLDPIDAPTADQATRVRAAIDRSAAEARDAVAALRQGFDAGLSFADELPRRLDAFSDRTGFPIDLELEPDATDLPGVDASECLRILDEALHNVQKHADATRIRVALKRDGSSVVLTVEDNGRGFVPGQPTAGHGLIGMRERARLLGGWLDVRSEPGDGTEVRLTLPAAMA